MDTQVLSQPFAKINLMNLPLITLRKVLLAGFILISSLLIFYIFQISEITKNSFAVSKYEREIIGLAQYNKNLEVSLSQNNSSANLEGIFKKFNYEKVNKVYYIQILDSEIAVK